MGSKRNKRQFYHDSRNPQEFLDKKYVFSDHFLDKTLPKQFYLSEKWSLSELQSRKFFLNSVKEKLSGFNLERWSKHTKWRDPSTLIIQRIREHISPELLTQAWCKFYECLNKFNFIPMVLSADTLRSLHLCEAPGGFISALNHHLYEKHPNIKFEWVGNSLNPYYEGTPLTRMIPDDRLINKTLNNWNFGLDFTGDVTTYYNHEYLVASTTKYGKVHIVTADGSVDCMLNPGDQETSVEFLHYCETLTALSVLEKGGNFILKIFTMFEESTVCLLLFLNSMFKNVTIFKPCTSKSGNSELYVICLYYKGYSTLSNESWQSLKQPYRAGNLTNSMFTLNEIDPNFMTEIFECSDVFSTFQINTMEANIEDYLAARKENVKARNEDIYQWFIHLYKIEHIPIERRLVRNYDVNIFRRKSNGNNRSIALKSISFDSSFIPLHFKIGKKINTVNYSSFCEHNLLLNLPLLKEMKDSTLINDPFVLCENNSLISYTDFKSSIDNYDDFQMDFFRKIYQSIKGNSLNIILYKIPFLTHFIVSVLYILQSGFNNSTFTDPDVISLNNSNNSNMINVIACFELIDKQLNNIKCTAGQYCFNPSLCSILDFTQTNVSFVERICRYNNDLLQSIKK